MPASTGTGEQPVVCSGTRFRPDASARVPVPGEPGAIATELANHITHADSKTAAEEATAEIGIPAEDIADVITFAVSRPQRVTLNEILVRPTAQPM
jgi:NADP-dependent 3-hydroxy acid dehydrogenase YdfG